MCGLTEPKRLLKAMSTYAESKAVGTGAEIRLNEYFSMTPEQFA